MIVWNYQDEKIQILEITQKGIQRELRNLAKDEDWGSPVDKYDIVITRQGEKLNTEYSVQPKPAKATDKKITEELAKTSIDLEALFKGDDPFKSSGNEEAIDPDEVKL